MKSIEPDAPRRLNLGCGFDHRPGYLNVDFKGFHNPDLETDIRDLSALESGAYEEALAFDVLEHLERKDVVPALREWRRVLAPEGTLRLRTPDLTGIGQMLSEHDDLDLHHRMVHGTYGTQAYVGDYHLAGFTDLTLIDHLFEAGFERIRVERLDGWLLVVEARRPVDAPDPLAIGLGHGIYPAETDGTHTWRWCAGRADILLFSRMPEPMQVRLELELFRPGDRTEIELLGARIQQRISVSAEAMVPLTLTVTPGPNRVWVLSHGAALAHDDPRQPYVQLRSLSARPLATEQKRLIGRIVESLRRRGLATRRRTT